VSGDYAIGVDLGATNIKLVAVTPWGEVLDQNRVATEDQFSTAWADRIRDWIRKTEAACGVAAHIGIASPGLAARDHRSITWMMGRMSGVMYFDWGTYLRRDNVSVLNDAHAALLGEIWMGAARGAADVVMLTLGTGVGGAIVSQGRLLRGAIGRAGHLGHISLDPAGEKDIVNTPASLENAIGECTLPARSGGKFTATRDLLAAVARNDDDAARVWLSSLRALAAGIVSIINVVDPELIIIGGGVAQAGDALLAPLEKLLDELEWRPNGHRVRIAAAELGDRAGALGAASFAMNREKMT
jgi:glucokinase